MADEKKYVGSDAALPRLWERVKALVANKANVITSGKMLSYSTEEQVVGRWIDGKPLYQVTIETTTGSKINTLKEIDLPTDDIEGISSINGIMTDSSGGYTPVSGAFVSNDTSTCVKIAYDASKKVLTIWCSQTNWLNAKICITVTYTKTTDTAESEVFDPVAFINKPNLWEPGKEYDFGDGVYGQRFTGNMPAIAAGKSVNKIIDYSISNSSNAKIIDTGGYIEMFNSSNNRFIIQANTVRRAANESNSMASLAMSWSSILIMDNNDIVMNAGSYTNDHFTTSNTYDVWVKYTK